jgi:hypothetical protein
MALLSSIKHLSEASYIFRDFAMFNLVDRARLGEEDENAIGKITAIPLVMMNLNIDKFIHSDQVREFKSYRLASLSDWSELNNTVSLTSCKQSLR